MLEIWALRDQGHGKLVVIPLSPPFPPLSSLFFITPSPSTN